MKDASADLWLSGWWGFYPWQRHERRDIGCEMENQKFNYTVHLNPTKPMEGRNGGRWKMEGEKVKR
jgi:hypothetical protein